MPTKKTLNLLEHQLLGNYLEIFRKCLEEEIEKRHIKNKKIANMNVHADFLGSLKIIRRKVAKSLSYDFKEIQNEIEKSAAKYLCSLRELFRNKGLDEEYLKAIQLGVGRALNRIDKVSAAAPKFQSTHFFVRFCKKFLQSILGLIYRKENTFLKNTVYSAKQLAFSKEIKDGIHYLEKANESIREKEFTKADENLYVRIFNYSPDKAIKLLPHGKKNLENVAKFLTNSHLFNEEQLADYLGTQGNEKILKEYVARKYIFEGQGFTDAIRKFLGTFKLPTEGQKITRVMEAFAKRYYEHNKDIFADEDAAYVLAVAVVMLNTDAYNPQIPAKKKMTEVQFINNLKGANGKKDFPLQMLSNIYREVKTQEIKRLDETNASKFKRPKM